MKKTLLYLMLLVVCAGTAFQAEARPFDIKNRYFGFNVGVSKALWSELEDDFGTVYTEYENPEWLLTFGMRIWIWKFGFSMDYTKSDVLNGIFSTNLYYRSFLGRQIAAFGGFGMSTTFGEEFMDIGIGYNFRAGAELLATKDISITAMVTWDTVTMFSYTDYWYDNKAPLIKLASLSLQATFYLF